MWPFERKTDSFLAKLRLDRPQPHSRPHCSRGDTRPFTALPLEQLENRAKFIFCAFENYQEHA